MSGSPSFDTEKKENRKIERGEFITPPRPTGRRSKKAVALVNDNRSVWKEFIKATKVLMGEFEIALYTLW